MGPPLRLFPDKSAKIETAARFFALCRDIPISSGPCPTVSSGRGMPRPRQNVNIAQMPGPRGFTSPFSKGGLRGIYPINVFPTFLRCRQAIAIRADTWVRPYGYSPTNLLKSKLRAVFAVCRGTACRAQWFLRARHASPLRQTRGFLHSFGRFYPRNPFVCGRFVNHPTKCNGTLLKSYTPRRLRRHPSY